MFSVGDRVVVIDGSDLSDYVCEWNPHMNKFVDSEFTICSVIHFARDRVGYCFAELQDTEDSDYIFDERRLRLHYCVHGSYLSLAGLTCRDCKFCNRVGPRLYCGKLTDVLIQVEPHDFCSDASKGIE